MIKKRRNGWKRKSLGRKKRLKLLAVVVVAAAAVVVVAAAAIVTVTAPHHHPRPPHHHLHLLMMRKRKVQKITVVLVSQCLMLSLLKLLHVEKRRTEEGVKRVLKPGDHTLQYKDRTHLLNQ